MPKDMIHFLLGLQFASLIAMRTKSRDFVQMLRVVETNLLHPQIQLLFAANCNSKFVIF